MSRDLRPNLAAILVFVRGWVVPVVVSLTLLALTTVLLWYVDQWPGTDSLVFIYFVPTTFVALRYGNTAAMFAILMSCLLAAYFLMPPEFSFVVSSPLDIMELIFFGLLAMLASRVVSGFMRDQNVARRSVRRRGASSRRPWISALFNRLRSAG